MKLKKMIAMLLIGATCVGMMAGCGSSSDDGGSAASSGSGENGTMTLIMGARDEFLSTLEPAAIAAAEEAGYKISSQDAQNDSSKQIQYIETAVNGGDAAVIVNPVDADAAQSLVDAANGTPLVFVNRMPTDMHVLDAENVAFCGSDEYQAGVYQGEALAEYFKAQGKTTIKYVLLQGISGQVSVTKRTDGVLDTLEAEGITATSVVTLACEWDRAKAIDKISPILTSGEEIDCIISNDDSMALGAVEACESAGIDLSTLPIVGVNCTKAAAEAIEAGQMLMSVYQDPVGQGKGAVEAAVNLINNRPANEGTEFVVDTSGESYSDSIIWIEFEPVNADNVADYL